MGKHPGQLKDRVASPGGTTMKEFMSLKRVHLCPTVQAWWFLLLLPQNVAMGWTSDFNFLIVQLIMLLVNLITSTKTVFLFLLLGTHIVFHVLTCLLEWRFYHLWNCLFLLYRDKVISFPKVRICWNLQIHLLISKIWSIEFFVATLLVIHI